MIKELVNNLYDTIKEYCDRHRLDMFEINWDKGYVAYFTHDDRHYDTFKYLEVDLTK